MASLKRGQGPQGYKVGEQGSKEQGNKEAKDQGVRGIRTRRT